MLRNFVAAAAVTLMIVGAAPDAVIAATREINIYGSVESLYPFIKDFLISKSCTIAKVEGIEKFDDNHRIIVGTNCHNTMACNSYSGYCYSNDTIVISLTAAPSFNSIKAVNNEGDPEYYYLDYCLAPNERRVATYNPDQTEFDPYGNLALDCRDIQLGISDLPSDGFLQISSGRKHGPNNSTYNPLISRNLITNPVDQSGLITYNPLVVPFAPFLSKNVTMKTCDGGGNSGEMCISAEDCPDSTCSAKELDNISREMLVQIFSGNAWYWSDFGAGFPDAPITICMRHAGSGAHAMLDHAIMHNQWGAGLASAESAADPIIWFNDSSSDMMKCITNFQTTDADDTSWYAIGYAKADWLENVGPGYAPYAYSPKYNGFKATRVNIRNGIYDWWSNQWMYVVPGESTNNRIVIRALVDFISNPANIHDRYWATQAEMVWDKGDDFHYPTYRGTDYPQSP